MPMTRGGFLLVSFHFGPGCETGGLRWNAMARDLAKNGWTVDVLTLARKEQLPDATGFYEFAPGVRVWPVPELKAFRDAVDAARRLGRLLRSARKQVTVSKSSSAAPRASSGDSVNPARLLASAYHKFANDVDYVAGWGDGLGWCRRAIGLALSLGRSRRWSCVVVSSPPHHTHLAGMRIARALGVPFVADFRDPLAIGHPLNRLEGVINPAYERKVLGAAQSIIFNTEPARALAVSLGLVEEARAHAVPNGYDFCAPPGSPDLERFRIVFAGWLYWYMDPRPLLAACARLKTRAASAPLPLQIVFMGGVDSAVGGAAGLAGLATSYGLGDCLQVLPRGTRQEALDLQESAAVLVVFEALHPASVAAKFYDSVALRGTVLLLGRADGALTDAAAPLGLRVCSPDDGRAIDGVLEGALVRWRAHDYAGPADAGGLLHRRRRSEQVDALLLALTAGEGMRPQVSLSAADDCAVPDGIQESS